MRNTAFEHDHVNDYRKHDAPPVLATHTVWQPHHGEEIIAACEKIAAQDITITALRGAALSARHLITSNDCYDADKLEEVRDSLDCALRVRS